MYIATSCGSSCNFPKMNFKPPARRSRASESVATCSRGSATGPRRPSEEAAVPPDPTPRWPRLAEGVLSRCWRACCSRGRSPPRHRCSSSRTDSSLERIDFCIRLARFVSNLPIHKNSLWLFQTPTELGYESQCHFNDCYPPASKGRPDTVLLVEYRVNFTKVPKKQHLSINFIYILYSRSKEIRFHRPHLSLMWELLEWGREGSTDLSTPSVLYRATLFIMLQLCHVIRVRW